MISRADALSHILSKVRRLKPVEVAIADAGGLVTVDPVVAARPVPPFANSAMDGVAVRSADSAPGARLRLCGMVAAGSVAESPVGPGEAMRIMTGAPMPEGADAVVMVELCRFDGDGAVVEVAAAVPVGNHVRPVGDDILAGSTVLASGAVVTPGVAALLRTVGLDRVTVVRRPRVGVFSTGDELVEPPQELGPGQIYDSNRAALVALVRDAGFEAVDLGVCPDDESQIEATILDGARRCDALVTSGGVSMGELDFVRTVLDRVGDMRWMQVAIRPAKPLAFGTVPVDGEDGRVVRSVPVLGLPGNPVSSMVSFELFARPALRKLAGHSVLERPMLRAVAGVDLARRRDGKTHFVRVVVSVDGAGRLVATSAGAQGSHHVAAMAAANALAVLDDGVGVLAGEDVSVLLLSPVG